MVVPGLAQYKKTYIGPASAQHSLGRHQPNTLGRTQPILLLGRPQPKQVGLNPIDLAGPTQYIIIIIYNAILYIN
jgi:hypothetical protein